MKYLCMALLLAFNLLHAQENTPAPEPTTAKDAALEKIFSSLGDQKAFPEALLEAKKVGIHQQILLEARFLHNVDLRDDNAIAAMAPEFIQSRDKFDPDNSEIFAVKDDWLGVVHYSQALAALNKGDKDGFKKHITEAFWLSPKQAQAFAPHVEELRQQDAMAKITIDPNRELKDQETQKPLSLGALLTDKKALVLHFWSPMSQEAQVNMPDFVLTTEACDQQNISVASILVGKYPGIRNDAEDIRQEDAAKAACTWLIDSDKKSISNKLRITTLPTMVIISPAGKIMFNGHPSNKDFWSTLKKVAPDFVRPQNANNHQDDHQHNHQDEKAPEKEK